MKELINALYEALEEVVEIMQEMKSSHGNMGQRRGRRRSGYRDYGSGMGQRNGMGQRDHEDPSEKQELLEALEEFMSQKYQ